MYNKSIYKHAVYFIYYIHLYHTLHILCVYTYKHTHKNLGHPFATAIQGLNGDRVNTILVVFKVTMDNISIFRKNKRK